jgi:alpha-galactosidase
MAVEAALTGDKRLLFQAIAFDPLTAAVLSLDEIQTMTNAMLEKNRDYLTNFRF